MTKAKGTPNIETNIVEIVAVVKLKITESIISALLKDSIKVVGSITKIKSKNGYIIYTKRSITKIERIKLNPDIFGFLEEELTMPVHHYLLSFNKN